MKFTFDINKNYEIPLITLCNPDKTEIAGISNFKNLHIKSLSQYITESAKLQTKNL